jgi:hypothetical protein
MHEASTRENPRIARYTAMKRRRHLGANINNDLAKRFIKHHPNADEIHQLSIRLSNQNCYSISTTAFDNYCSVRGEAKNTLGPLYEQ